jgi:hypothetical protein
MAKLAARLDALGLSDIRFVGPDGARTITDLQNFGSAMLGNSAVMAKMAKWAIHSYGPSVTLVWDGFDAVYNHAIRAGRGTVPHNDLGNGRALIAYDTVTRLYEPRQEFYEYAQLFKFVAPGAVRIGATDDDGNLTVLAFRHPATGRLTVVGRNTSAAAMTVNGTLNNLPAPVSTLETYRSNFSLNLQRGADVSVTGSTFAVAIPANTVFTLVTPLDGGTPPTVASAAAANPNRIVSGTTTELSALGADDGGEAALTYTWSATAKPAGAADPTYQRNASNAAKNVTATLYRAGSYTFRVTIADIGGQSATSSVNVTADAVPGGPLVLPASVALERYATQQFTAFASDQFGQPLGGQPAFAWSVNGGGNVGANGLFTAGGALGGPFTITATSAGGSVTAAVSIVAVSGTIGGTGEGSFTDNLWDGAITSTRAASRPRPA